MRAVCSQWVTTSKLLGCALSVKVPELTGTRSPFTSVHNLKMRRHVRTRLHLGQRWFVWRARLTFARKFAKNTFLLKPKKSSPLVKHEQRTFYPAKLFTKRRVEAKTLGLTLFGYQSKPLHFASTLHLLTQSFRVFASLYSTPPGPASHGTIQNSCRQLACRALLFSAYCRSSPNVEMYTLFLRVSERFLLTRAFTLGGSEPGCAGWIVEGWGSSLCRQGSTVGW